MGFIGRHQRLRMLLINQWFLLAYLSGGLGGVFGLFLFTAPHALAHPIAHVSCVTHQPESLQAKETNLRPLNTFANLIVNPLASAARSFPLIFTFFPHLNPGFSFLGGSS